MKNYLIIAIAIIVAGAYFFGARIGRMKCQSSARRAETEYHLSQYHRLQCPSSHILKL